MYHVTISMKEAFHQRLKLLIHQYIMLGYKVSEKFPKTELYGMTSQARRALLSIMLNYIEGYGRVKRKVMVNFYETSFGSLKESIYVFFLGLSLEYILKEEYIQLYDLKEEIARMLWKTIDGLNSYTDEPC